MVRNDSLGGRIWNYPVKGVIMLDFMVRYLAAGLPRSRAVLYLLNWVLLPWTMTSTEACCLGCPRTLANSPLQSTDPRHRP